MPDSIVYTPTPRNAVKVLSEKSDALTVGGHLVVFDDPASPTKDLAGDYFSRDTDFGPARELKMTGQLFHHGMPLKNGTVLDGPLPLLKLTEDEIGIFVETTYDMANEYHRAVGTAIKNSIEKGTPFGWSSSTALQTYKRAEDGHLLKWWLIEGSPTPTPCEPRTVAGTKLLGKAVPLSSLSGSLKAENITARVSAVYDAFYRMCDAAGDWDSYVAEIWDEYLVVRVSAVVAQGYYRVAYSYSAGTATLAPVAEWEQVQPTTLGREWETVKAMYEAHVAKSTRFSGPEGSFDPELLALSLKLQNQNLAIKLRA